jgi:hypothetical protein
LEAHVDGTPWSFVIALNDSKEYDGGGTHFIHSDFTCRPQKAGSAVLFSGKNLHEGLAITSGVRYILTGFCEYVHERNFDDRCTHTSFLRDYDVKYDGYAALGGVHTGDVIKGIYDVNGLVQYFNQDNDMHSVLNRVRRESICTSTGSNILGTQVTAAKQQHRKPITSNSNKTKVPQCSILVERLMSTEYYDYDHECDIINQINDNHDDTLGELGAKGGKDDDRDILDLIHGVDQFFSVGQYWQFDE